MRHTLKVTPLTLGRLLFKRLPDLRRNHSVDKLVFALRDLDDLLNQTRAKSALKIRDTAKLASKSPKT
jgi:hypothetical protein